MPLYSYRCEACDHEFNEVKNIDDRNQPTLEKCPACGAEPGTVYKQIESARIVSGVGDFRRKVPDAFKDRLREIKKNSGRGNTIDV